METGANSFGTSFLAPLLVFLLLCLSGSFANAQVIVIDPGHGGNDPGGTGNSLLEKTIVLDVSGRFRDLLIADTEDADGGGSWAPHLTRDTDVFIELAARAAYANSLDADRFLSVHANAFGTASANGTETFSYNEGTTSAALRNLIQEEMVDAWQLTNRGNKTASFSVLRNTAMPAELHELGFVTNTVDAAKLSSEDAREEAALAHLHALQRHYGLAAYTPGDSDDASPLATLEVTVLDSQGPVAGATVFLDGDEQGQSTDDGTLRISNLVAGDYLISASSPDHEPGDATAQLEAGEVLSATIELVRNENGDDRGRVNDDDDDDTTGSLIGGCSQSGNSASWPLLVLLVALLFRKRTRRA